MNPNKTPVGLEVKTQVEACLPQAKAIYANHFGPYEGEEMSYDRSRGLSWACIWDAICVVEPGLAYTDFDAKVIEAAVAWVLSKGAPPQPQVSTADRAFQLALANAQLSQTRAAHFHAMVVSGASTKNFEGHTHRYGEGMSNDELIKRDLQTAQNHLQVAQEHLDTAAGLSK